jgi:hypothetical protein
MHGWTTCDTRPNAKNGDGTMSEPIVKETWIDAIHLRLEHRDLPAETAASHTAGWNELLRRLAGAVRVRQG